MGRPQQNKRMPVSRQQNCNAIKERLRKKAAIKVGAKTICVTGIMKNESKNVNRLLDSLLSLPPDMISIVDTGSTDNTAELILEWGKAHDIPTVVHHENFVNFAYNRTHSIKAAKKAFPEADYFLLTDADFVWEINRGGTFNKVLLVDHRYQIEQYNGRISYWNTRLLSSKVDFECVGVTHEFWRACKEQSYNGEIRTSKINTIAIDDKEDGGCKQDKFERDERLLKAGLEDPKTPKDLKTRYKFYLAQTYRDTHRYHESIDLYQQRVDDGGWAEEIYYSKYKIGFGYEQLGWASKQCLHLLDKEDKTEQDNEYLSRWNAENLNKESLNIQFLEYFELAHKHYLDAYNFRKTRAESLYKSTKLYRLMGRNQEAFDNAMKGRKIEYPKSDTLFIERACYDYLFDFELSITGFYCGNKEVGSEACAKLVLRDDLPGYVNNVVERNCKFYL